MGYLVMKGRATGAINPNPDAEVMVTDAANASGEREGVAGHVHLPD
jgi:hypothetical protein